MQRLQLQYATTNSSSAIPAVRANGLRSDCIHAPALGASLPLPLISTTSAMRRLFNDSQVLPARALGAHVSIDEVPGDGYFRHALRITSGGECPAARTEGLGTPHRQDQLPARALGAHDSINGVPGGGPSCHNALQINRRGEGPGLRGPAPSLCGLSDQARSALVPGSTGGMPGGGVPPCHHAVPSTRGGECSGLTRGPSAPHRKDPRRLTPVLDDSIGKVPGSSGLVRSHAHADHKVLRFWQAGHCSSPRLARSNRDLPHGSDLAVKGDALIHRPCLVAGLVGSEWRTRRPV